ncbi:MAG: radical SAM family heme chaperone HemW [Hyphomonadaceae bacterium]|nr:radical SAM family heme chaperone HemW [Hyphomonadaceae bacterium]MBP9234430.1 radical SAM family heme chaperone HemW [Hyphomonadaceae bacterium]
MSGFNPQRGFGVYVHWPYCARVCPYCDFNVYAAKARDTAPLFGAVLRDLESWRERTGPRQADAIFLGGGTPSLMTGEQVEGVIAKVDELWDLRPGAEVTLEANPDDAARFPDFAAAGVNRLSLGLQSLDDARLKFLGRTHTGASALAALETALGKFRSTSIDLIYALPNQTAEDWRAELARTLSLGADHLSLYELSIEPGAAFFQAVKRKDWSPLDDERAADLYQITQELADAAGYSAYEISNHARGREHQSTHNRIYWSSGDWAAVGPGAHGRLTNGPQRWAIEAAEKPGEYLRQVRTTGLGWAVVDTLDPLAQARERVSMGLRVVEGFAISDITELDLQLAAAPVAEFAAAGLITNENGRIALTRSGRLMADRIAAEISP